MQGYHQEQPSAQRYAGGRAQLHDGTQRFMTGVYGWMTAGLGVSAATAYGISLSPEATMWAAGHYWFLFIPIIAMAWMLPSRLPKMDKSIALGLFFVFSILMGASLSPLPYIYSAASILGIFITTAAIFAGMAAIGFFTKKDLTGMGQFFVMALLGVIAASIVNVFFVHSGGISLLLSGAVALLAAGLTAYHTQAIKQLYRMHGGGSNLAILGALLLYIDFINLFLSLLRLFGGGRD